MPLAALKRLVKGSKLEPWARHWWRRLPVGRDQGVRYDLETEEILRRFVPRDGACVDVGCHRGVIMDEILRYCPGGHHIGVEPIPEMAAFLRRKYANRPNVEIVQGALGAEPGHLDFVHNVDNPQTSGLLKRDYPDETNRTVTLRVAVRRLDDVVPAERRTRFVKIDVEGAEHLVLAGGLGLLARHRPIVVFEHGKGAADVYGSGPERLLELFGGCGLRIGLMADLLAGRPPLAPEAFIGHYARSSEYYFAAWDPAALEARP